MKVAAWMGLRRGWIHLSATIGSDCLAHVLRWARAGERRIGGMLDFCPATSSTLLLRGIHKYRVQGDFQGHVRVRLFLEGRTHILSRCRPQACTNWLAARCWVLYTSAPLETCPPRLPNAAGTCLQCAIALTSSSLRAAGAFEVVVLQAACVPAPCSLKASLQPENRRSKWSCG